MKTANSKIVEQKEFKISKVIKNTIKNIINNLPILNSIMDGTSNPTPTPSLNSILLYT